MVPTDEYEEFDTSDTKGDFSVSADFPDQENQPEQETAPAEGAPSDIIEMTPIEEASSNNAAIPVEEVVLEPVPSASIEEAILEQQAPTSILEQSRLDAECSARRAHRPNCDCAGEYRDPL